MDLFQPWHVAVVSVLLSVFGPLIIIPYWKIFQKAGFVPVFSLLMLVPLVNLVVLYYVAFSNWKTGVGNGASI